MLSTGRPRGRFFCFWLICVLLASVALPTESWAAIPKTSVNDILYRADGTPAHGTVTIRWNGFTASDGSTVAAGVLAVKIGANGSFAVQLVPNTGAKPDGSYYKVVMKLDDGTTSEEAWAVPAAPTTTVAAVRAMVMPASAAVQYVGRDYVDSAVAAAVGNNVQTNGSYADPVWLSSLSSSKLVGTLPANVLPTSVANTSSQNTFGQAQTFANINGCRYAGQVGAGTIQSAIADAGTNGCVIIPKSYAGADTFTNPNGIAIVDYRRGTSISGTLNVMDYGADPTGANDSLAAFQAAHDAKKGCVYVPPGTYKLSGPVRYSFGACFTGNPAGDYSSIVSVIKPAVGSVAFAPANPLTLYVGLTFKNLQIVGGKNGIDLGLSTETYLDQLVFWDYSGFGITHVMGERHTWKNIHCEHQSVAAIGCISLNDPTRTLDSAAYLANGWTGANAAGWFDRGELDHIKDFGWQSLNSGAAQDQYLIKATTSSCLGCGQVSNFTLKNPMTMWSANQGIVHFDGNVRFATFSDFVMDSLGSAASPIPSLIYIGNWADSITIRNFTPANGAAMNYTNGINVRGDLTASTIMNSELGGDGVNNYGLRLGGGNPQNHVLLQSSSGYVYVESTVAKFQNQAFSVVGGAISSNLGVLNFIPNSHSNSDWSVFFPPPDALTSSYTGNVGFRRFYSGSIVTDLNLGATSSYVRTPFTMQNGGTVLGALSIGNNSYQTTLQSGTLGASNTLTLPTSNDTLVGRATNDTLTNKTLDTGGSGNVLKIGGTQVTAVTGTGSVALANSPTLVAPNIGAATATSVTASGTVTGSNIKAGAALNASGNGTAAVTTTVTNDTAGQAACWDGSHNLTNSGCASTGTSGVVYHTSMTNQTGSIGLTTAYTTATDGTFRVSFYMSTTTAGTAGTVSPTVSFNDGAAHSYNAGNLTLTSTGNYVQSTQVIHVSAGQSIAYQTVVSGATGTPAYRVDVVVERLQ